jgi:hypothetical protein
MALARCSASARSAHGCVRPFITFTPVVDVSIAQQQAVVQRVFWVRFEPPVGHSRLARSLRCSGKQLDDPLSGSANALRHFAVGTSTLSHTRLVAAPCGMATSRTRGGACAGGTFHDNRVESVIFRAALRRWAAPHALSCLAACRSHNAYPPASLSQALDERTPRP